MISNEGACCATHVERVAVCAALLSMALAAQACGTAGQPKRPTTNTSRAPAELGPAPVTTEVVGVGRIPFSTIVAAVGTNLFAPVAVTNKATIGSWSCELTQSSAPTIRADAEQLVVSVPVMGSARLSIGKTKHLNQVFMHAVIARVKPVLQGTAVRFEVDSVTTRPKAGPMGKAAGFLHAESAKLLADLPVAALRGRFDTIELQLSNSVFPAPLYGHQPITVADNACLTLRPSRIVVTRVSVDPSNLRLAASVPSEPTLTPRCPTGQAGPHNARAPSKALLSVNENRTAQMTQLTVRVRTAVPAGAATRLDIAHAGALVLQRVESLNRRAEQPARTWPTRLTQATAKILSQTVIGDQLEIDARVAGWLVVGETRSE
jgi:hypothetical protein